MNSFVSVALFFETSPQTLLRFHLSQASERFLQLLQERIANERLNRSNLRSSLIADVLDVRFHLRDRVNRVRAQGSNRNTEEFLPHSATL